VRAFVDTVIKELFESGAIPNKLIHPKFNPPHRGDAPCTFTTFQLYVTVLTNLGNPQDDEGAHGSSAPPPRPAKRNVQMVYNLDGDFPTFLGATIRPPKEPSQRTAAAAPTPSTVVTLDSPTQLREEMKTEFMKRIQTEVQTQIQTEMADIQADVVNLA
jgi:hypothetical protein